MSHPEQMAFCQEVRDRFPEHFTGSRVLEIGSRNVNGSIRFLFTNCEYTGIDFVDGPDVDWVGLGHEYEAEPGSFSVVCSTETLEHDPYAVETVGRMVELLRPGGLFFLTCASTGRPYHGDYGPDPDFYRNVAATTFIEWLPDSFRELLIRYNPHPGDLYCWGIKASG